MEGRIIFRVDGSEKIGLGHIVRCVALSKMIASLECDIIFFSMQMPAALQTELITNDIHVEIISQEEDFFSALEADDIVILDNYFFDLAYQKRVAATVFRLICIDDLIAYPFCADLIINHSPSAIAAEYETCPWTEFALGPRYALLRPEFLDTIEPEVEKVNASIAICFGGADPNNLTETITKLVAASGKFSRIIAITGATHPNPNSIDRLVSTNGIVHHNHQLTAKEMATAFRESEYAIVPASGILFEALSCGCKVLSGYFVDNQKKVFKSFLSLGAVADGGEFGIQQVSKGLDVLLNKPTKEDAIIDGLSDRRLFKIFHRISEEKNVSVKPATELDNQKTFSWAADPEVRKHSLNTHPITVDEHNSWFQKKISDENCRYFIVYLKARAVGSVRFDRRDRKVILSYLIDPAFQGQNLGLAAVKLGLKAIALDHEFDFDEIHAMVLPENIPSLKVFERLGFQKQREQDNYLFIKPYLKSVGASN